MSVQILGVRIDELTKNQVLTRIGEFLHGSKQHMVCTPNPEMLVATRRDFYFKEVLNESDLNVCDGKGVELAAMGKLERIPGVELMQEICRIAAEEKKSVYLLGSRHRDIAEQCGEKLKNKYLGLSLAGAESSLQITQDQDSGLVYDQEQNEKVLEKIIMAAPDILFVALGHGKQEKWIYENLPHLPSVKIAMGVGGAFDFIAGYVTRAPQWMQRVGLEWLWRLLCQPWRAKRIWNALVIFPLLVISERLKKKA